MKLRSFTTKKITDARSAFFMLIAALVVGACATTAAPPTGKLSAADLQKRALERSAARWKALTDKRFEESFAFLSEASRVGTTPSEYAAAMQRMGFVAATNDEVSCEETLCILKTKVTLPVFVRNVGARLQTIPIEEHWIVNNGELWLIRR
jgi:hypothetical protein